MPIGDPERSFEAAVRHLFRHIRDAYALRRNPLAASLFAQRSNTEADRVALALLHGQILELADACRQEDARQRRNAQAVRQYTIIENLCIGEPAASTARRLNLSLRQYYRERRTICSRIGRRLMKGKATNAAIVDSDEQLDLACRRARNVAEQGFIGKAIELLRHVVAEAPPGRSKKLALLHLSRMFTLYGDVTRAQAALCDAEELSGDESPERSLTLDLIHGLAMVDRQFELGDYAETASIVSGLPTVAPETAAHLPIGAQEALVESYVTRTAIGFIYGLDESRRRLAELQRIVHAVGRVSPYLEVLIASQEAKLAECDRDCPERGFLQNDRLLRLSEVVGSAQGMVCALIGLARYYLSGGSEDDAYRCFKRAYAIADVVDGTWLKLQVAAQASYFVSTRFSHAVATVIDEAIALVRPGTAEALRLQAAAGQYLVQMGRLEEALAVFETALTIARTWGSSCPYPMIAREYAVALYRAGQKERASELIREAVLMAEQVPDGLALSKTYRVATHILMDRNP